MNDLANPAIIIDAMGKPCPMPLLMLKRAIKNKSDHLFLLKSSTETEEGELSRLIAYSNPVFPELFEPIMTFSPL